MKGLLFCSVLVFSIRNEFGWNEKAVAVCEAHTSAKTILDRTIFAVWFVRSSYVVSLCEAYLQIMLNACPQKNNVSDKL